MVSFLHSHIGGVWTPGIIKPTPFIHPDRLDYKGVIVHPSAH